MDKARRKGVLFAICFATQGNQIACILGRPALHLTTTKQQTTTFVLSAVVWALALIGSAFVFKGSPIKDWIQSLLFVAGVNVWLWLWQSRRQARLRC
jgi:hypothetical protein